ncbi:CatA-like O-acetyltransferase [Mucilaginibacter calamicampi]|uniref:CatA-like O-acetyltransferase n=1 Tax=Mucilaginibacter calamicampi TaxID=1302352 RepID=A0ABW2YXN3_9SPHI
MYKEIDLQNWSRLDTYKHFSAFELPFFNICNNVDITPVYQKCKINNLSVSLALQYCCLQAANAVDEFKLRILDNKVVQYDVIHAGAIVLLPDNNIRFCLYEHTADFADFQFKAENTRQEVLATRQTQPRSQEQDVIHFSVLPWVSFTSISHPRGVNSKMESIPKITLGKFFKSDGRILLPISVEVNHCLMDGYHLGLFNEQLTHAIHNF